MSRVGFALVLAIGAGSLGCSVLNREEYSLILRKPAHVYRPLTPGEAGALAARADPRRIEPKELFPSRAGTPRLNEPVLHQPALEPFRPFAYCHLHQSAHALESAVAIVAAPLEYPLCLATNVTWLAMTATLRELEAFWRGLFGPRDPPPAPPMPEKDPDRRR